MILIKLIHKCLCRSSKHNMKMKCIFSAYPPALNKDSKHTATHSGHERQMRLYNRAPIVFLQLLNDYYIIIALISNSCCFTITHNFLPMFPIRATLSTMHKTQSTDGSEKTLSHVVSHWSARRVFLCHKSNSDRFPYTLRPLLGK